MAETPYVGGCLCGALRYEARGEPQFAGHCYCEDCRKASGSGFMPFMGFAAAAVTVTGETRHVISRAWNGGEAVRNICPTCGSLVFGGRYGVDDSHTIYAGSLDRPERFKPTMALFNARRPAWATLPEGVTVFDTMPTGPRPEPQAS
ncbi:GFA family protein [Caulobacter sp. KR2-114]|uniref:GFA family protein n=1 Tax=Caulobacter sp. KR2-114 TaxID=3400912 RepID=UPI003BFE89EC